MGRKQALVFISQLNKFIDESVVRIDDHCERIEMNLISRARKVKSELSKNTPGRQRQHILDQPYNLFILENELESFQKSVSEREMAIQTAEEWRQKAQHSRMK